MQSCAYVARVGRVDYGECFGQYPVSLEGSYSGSGRVSGLEGLRADFLCLHCSPNAVGDNTWAYIFDFGGNKSESLSIIVQN